MEKNKHDHKGTKRIKVGLFACLMFAPILAILSSCMYVMFNKNAKESYQEQVNVKEYVPIQSMGQIQIGNTFHFLSSYTLQEEENTGEYAISNVENVITTYNHPEYLEQATKLLIYETAGATQLRIKYGQSETTAYISLANYQVSMDFQIELIPTQTTSYNPALLINYLSTIEINNNSYLTNVFYYACNQVEKQPIFNWVQNTTIYRGIQLMTTGLGAQTHTLDTMLSYWFFITVIYVIVDIILELFVMITHLITKNN